MQADGLEDDWDEFDDRDDEIDLSEEICEDCWGVGWIYGEMRRTPHLSHYDCRRLAKERGQSDG